MKKEYNQIYIVKEHDSIDSISKKYGLSPLKILIDNNVSPKMIKKGKILFIKTNIK